jgi:ABC-type uncharacterized transport system permease subunit
MRFLRPIVAAFAGILLGFLVTLLAGENPLKVFAVLAQSAFGSPYDFGMTIFYATPLIFTGLSVAIAFKAGLFNIGAEGQLTMGALACAAVGIFFPELSPLVAIPLGIFMAFVGGSLYGFVPGYFLVKRGSHEVITTIMLNFIAAALSSWVALNLIPNPASQNPESRPVGNAFLLERYSFFQDAPVTAALFLAIFVVGVCAFLLRKTYLGFSLKACGENASASEYGGISTSRTKILAMVLAGGLAGLVGVVEIMGNSGRFRLDFSPGYGFTGIAVAFLARSEPLAIVPAALLFGALHKGTLDLDFEFSNMSRDLALVLQALIILSLSADGLWSKLIKSRAKPPQNSKSIKEGKS